MNEDAQEPKRDQTPCPLCGRPAADQFSPFCSRRCAQVDLGRWMSGNYVIAGESVYNPADSDDDNVG